MPVAAQPPVYSQGEQRERNEANTPSGTAHNTHQVATERHFRLPTVRRRAAELLEQRVDRVRVRHAALRVSFPAYAVR